MPKSVGLMGGVQELQVGCPVSRPMILVAAATPGTFILFGAGEVKYTAASKP